MASTLVVTRRTVGGVVVDSGWTAERIGVDDASLGGLPVTWVLAGRCEGR